MEEGVANAFKVLSDGLLEFRGRVCIPRDDKLRRAILEEAHSSDYTIHTGSTKMYRNSKGDYC